jgi:hypothetical protein
MSVSATRRECGQPLFRRKKTGVELLRTDGNSGLLDHFHERVIFTIESMKNIAIKLGIVKRLTNGSKSAGELLDFF